MLLSKSNVAEAAVCFTLKVYRAIVIRIEFIYHVL